MKPIENLDIKDIKQLEMAAIQGDEKAQIELVASLTTKSEDEKHSFITELIKKAILHRETHLFSSLGHCFEYGQGIAKDFEIAFFCYLISVSSRLTKIQIPKTSDESSKKIRNLFGITKDNIKEKHRVFLSRRYKVGAELYSIYRKNHTFLRLTHIDIEVFDLADVLKVITVNPAVRGLNLTKTELNNACARMLGNFLRSNKTLHKLTINDNLIDDSGLMEILEGLESNTTLIELNIRLHLITDRGLQALAHTLERNHWLVEVGLPGKSFDIPTGKRVQNLLTLNRFFRQFGILPEHSEATAMLRFKDLGITDQLIKEFAAKRAYWPWKTELDLSYNPIGQKGEQNCEEDLLTLSPILTKLDLTGTYISDATQAELKSLLTPIALAEVKDSKVARVNHSAAFKKIIKSCQIPLPTSLTGFPQAGLLEANNTDIYAGFKQFVRERARIRKNFLFNGHFMPFSDLEALIDFAEDLSEHDREKSLLSLQKNIVTRHPALAFLIRELSQEGIKQLLNFFQQNFFSESQVIARAAIDFKLTNKPPHVGYSEKQLYVNFEYVDNLFSCTSFSKGFKVKFKDEKINIECKDFLAPTLAVRFQESPGKAALVETIFTDSIPLAKAIFNYYCHVRYEKIKNITTVPKILSEMYRDWQNPLSLPENKKFIELLTNMETLSQQDQIIDRFLLMYYVNQKVALLQWWTMEVHPELTVLPEREVSLEISQLELKMDSFHKRITHNYNNQQELKAATILNQEFDDYFEEIRKFQGQAFARFTQAADECKIRLPILSLMEEVSNPLPWHSKSIGFEEFKISAFRAQSAKTCLFINNKLLPILLMQQFDEDKIENESIWRYLRTELTADLADKMLNYFSQNIFNFPCGYLKEYALEQSQTTDSKNVNVTGNFGVHIEKNYSEIQFTSLLQDSQIATRDDKMKGGSIKKPAFAHKDGAKAKLLTRFLTSSSGDFLLRPYLYTNSIEVAIALFQTFCRVRCKQLKEDKESKTAASLIKIYAYVLPEIPIKSDFVLWLSNMSEVAIEDRDHFIVSSAISLQLGVLRVKLASLHFNKKLLIDLKSLVVELPGKDEFAGRSINELLILYNELCSFIEKIFAKSLQSPGLPKKIFMPILAAKAIPILETKLRLDMPVNEYKLASVNGYSKENFICIIDHLGEIFLKLEPKGWNEWHETGFLFQKFCKNRYMEYKLIHNIPIKNNGFFAIEDLQNLEKKSRVTKLIHKAYREVIKNPYDYPFSSKEDFERYRPLRNRLLTDWFYTEEIICVYYLRNLASGLRSIFKETHFPNIYQWEEIYEFFRCELLQNILSYNPDIYKINMNMLIDLYDDLRRHQFTISSLNLNYAAIAEQLQYSF